MSRAYDCLIDQTGALRKRMLMRELRTRKQKGAYWGIDTLVASYKDPKALMKDCAATAELARVPTKLAAFDADVHRRLVEWGYALADVGVRRGLG